MKLLFIGNSHTYHHDMPAIVEALFAAMGQKSGVAMLTAGGKNLSFHAGRPDVAFNIKYGRYDAVILQEKAMDFSPETFREGATALKKMADSVGTPSLFFMPFLPIDAGKQLPALTETFRSFCSENGCQFAPVGEVFSKLVNTAEHGLYESDGRHATVAGSYVAAVTVFYTVTGRKRILEPATIDDPGKKLGLSLSFCRQVHTEACRTSRIYNG